MLLATATVFSGLFVLLVAFFVLEKGVPALWANGFDFVAAGGWDMDLEYAWSEPSAATFGARPLVAGTLWSTALAVAASVVLGLGCAIVISELAPSRLRRPIEALVQLLAGIPSVVYGLVGFSVVVPFITQHVLPPNAWEEVPGIPYDGQSLLAAVIVLTLMIMPFFVAVATDSLRSVPRSLLDGARALGLTRWRAIRSVQIPVALPGLIAGAVLASSRAIGEAIALSMVAGALAATPGFDNGVTYFLLTPIRTMASAIVETGGEAMSIASIEAALFALATLLLLASLILSVAARMAFAWSARRMSVVTGRVV
jgi:phosphate ABC transporter permease protein PstC